MEVSTDLGILGQVFSYNPVSTHVSLCLSLVGSAQMSQSLSPGMLECHGTVNGVSELG